MSNEKRILAFIEKSRSLLNNYVPFEDDKLFVAGGVFCRIYNDMPIRDIDVFVKKEHFQYVCDQYTSRDRFRVVLEKPQFRKLTCFENNEEIQIDLINFHDPQDIRYLDSFDLKHCMFALEQKNFDHHADWLRCVSTKVIEVNETLDMEKHQLFLSNSYCDPNNTLARIAKYLELGFTITEQEMTKLYRKLQTSMRKK